MQIIPPISITSSNLTASNITENDHDDWASGTTYAAAAKVIYEHKRYESIAGSNAGNQPDITPLKWLLLGATNRFRAFDKTLNDQAERADVITYEIDHDGNAIDSIALFNLDAASVQIEVTDDNDGLVYDQAFPLIDNTDITNWYDYFFAPVGVTAKELVVTDIPPYGTAETTITITKTGSTAKVGQIVLGRSNTLGTSLFGTTTSIEDFSRKERDPFGNAIIVERPFAENADYKFKIITSDARRIKNTFAKYRAKPVVWIGTPDESYGTVIYGFYNRFDINITSPTLSDVSAEVEGLT